MYIGPYDDEQEKEEMLVSQLLSLQTRLYEQLRLENKIDVEKLSKLEKKIDDFFAEAQKEGFWRAHQKITDLIKQNYNVLKKCKESFEMIRQKIEQRYFSLLKQAKNPKLTPEQAGKLLVQIIESLQTYIKHVENKELKRLHPKNEEFKKIHGESKQETVFDWPFDRRDLCDPFKELLKFWQEIASDLQADEFNKPKELQNSEKKIGWLFNGLYSRFKKLLKFWQKDIDSKEIDPKKLQRAVVNVQKCYLNELEKHRNGFKEHYDSCLSEINNLVENPKVPLKEHEILVRKLILVINNYLEFYRIRIECQPNLLWPRSSEDEFFEMSHLKLFWLGLKSKGEIYDEEKLEDYEFAIAYKKYEQLRENFEILWKDLLSDMAKQEKQMLYQNFERKKVALSRGRQLIQLPKQLMQQMMQRLIQWPKKLIQQMIWHLVAQLFGRLVTQVVGKNAGAGMNFINLFQQGDSLQQVDLPAEKKYAQLILIASRYIELQKSLLEEFEDWFEEYKFDDFSERFKEIILKLKIWQDNSQQDLLMQQARLNAEFEILRIGITNSQTTAIERSKLTERMKKISREYQLFLLSDQLPQLMRDFNQSILQEVASRSAGLLRFMALVQAGKKVFSRCNLEMFYALQLPQFKLGQNQQEKLYSRAQTYQQNYQKNLQERYEQVRTNVACSIRIICIAETLCIFCRIWRGLIDCNYVAMTFSMFKVGFNMWGLRDQRLVLEEENKSFAIDTGSELRTVLFKHRQQDNQQIFTVAQNLIKNAIKEDNDKLITLQTRFNQQFRLQLVNVMLHTVQNLVILFFPKEQQTMAIFLVNCNLSSLRDNFKKINIGLRAFLPKSWTNTLGDWTSWSGWKENLTDGWNNWTSLSSWQQSFNRWGSFFANSEIGGNTNSAADLRTTPEIHPIH